MKNNNLYILCVLLLSSCGDSGTATTDEPTPDTAIGLTLSKETATTSSSGDSDTFTVKLKTKESVSVSISSSNPDAGTVNPTSLSFSESNWNVNQTVTVTGLCDAFHTSGTNKTTYNVVLSPSSANYSSTQNKTVTVSDNDKAAFNISSMSGNVFEKGDNATFNMRLCSQPTSDVSIGVSSSDTTEGTVLTNSLSFSADNWSTAQTVTVFSVDDNLSDDDETFSIVLAAASSSDSNYNSLNPNDVTVINKDNDTADITVSKTTLTTSEAGGAESFTVVLDTGPESDVTIIPISSNKSWATVAPSNLTFSSSNWDSAQTFTVTGVDDKVDNISADNEIDNITIVKKILKIMDKSEDLIEFVEDRPGHDFRYSMNSSKIKNELGWTPKFDFDKGLENTVNWYLSNENWWKDINKKTLASTPWKNNEQTEVRST